MNEEILQEEITGPKKTGIATAALVFGILSILTICIFLNYVFGLIGLILAIVYLVKKGQKFAKGRAIAALICCVISIGISSVIWYGIYDYLMNTSVIDLAEDLQEATGGEFNVQQMVDDSIDSYLDSVVGDQANAAKLEEVEQMIGITLDYEGLCQFVGEEVTVKKLQKFVGDGIDATELSEVITNMDHQAAVDDIGGAFTYKALEEKLGEGFTYDELLEYLKQFQ